MSCIEPAVESDDGFGSDAGGELVPINLQCSEAVPITCITGRAQCYFLNSLRAKK